ncbi:hypothetical protein ACFC4G_47685 [Streptomyces sp. NPDC056002]|uniref:hypothetical protein n=1 Tax=Streptomyces sp. NPDC056002 TaxID=3345675 RepID=UPI0035DB9EF7
MTATTIYDPAPSFCRWFVEPTLYAFERRQVMTALLDDVRRDTGAQRAGLVLRARAAARGPVTTLRTRWES